MGIIHKLDDHLTNMIAAGEVVERPMGVIKELVENAIDAKATRIEVVLVEGGMNMISVIDNGIGMDPNDATQAFERHSTSKIAVTNDLWSISTLGFRGEALPSIASVSKVVCLTNNGENATRVEIQYGKLISVTPYASPLGTMITVEGLFLKTPARLKHMKSVPYETAIIVDLLDKFALCYPHIAFICTADSKMLLQSTGRGDLTEVMFRKYKSDIAKAAVPFERKNYDFKLSGALVLPHYHRASRNDMIIFMNQRLIKSFRLQKAIQQGYRDYLPDDRFPIVVLNVEVDFQLVDVNVHPSKWEIRLSKQQQCELFIQETIQNVLKEHMHAATIRQQPKTAFVMEQSGLFDSNEKETISREIKTEESILPSFLPINQGLESNPRIESIPFTYESKDISDSVGYVQETPIIEKVAKKGMGLQLPPMRVLAQLHQKYILAQNEDGLFILDQHAAMERVRYEMFQDLMIAQSVGKQPLLVPIVIQGYRKAAIQKEEVISLFSTLDVEVELLGEEQFVIRELPLWMKEIDPQAAIEDLFQRFEDGGWRDEKSLRKHTLASLACHSSIRFNRVLSVDEMQRIVDDLSNCNQPFHCPHGRPTLISFDAQRLAKEFDR